MPMVEFMPGGSLHDRMKGGERFDRETAILLLEEIAAALDEAHRRGIVGCDVEPARVLVDHGGPQVLADSGPPGGTTTGTPIYMSPEQVMGAAWGPPADIYALTTMAYELLTGGTPFEGEEALGILYAHVHRQPPAASTKNPELTPAVDGVLARGLAKDPAARWESGAAMVNALRAALQASTRSAAVVGSAAEMPASPLATPATFPARRRYRPALLVRVTTIVLIGAALGLLVLARGTPTG